MRRGDVAHVRLWIGPAKGLAPLAGETGAEWAAPPQDRVAAYSVRLARAAAWAAALLQAAAEAAVFQSAELLARRRAVRRGVARVAIPRRAGAAELGAPCSRAAPLESAVLAAAPRRAGAAAPQALWAWAAKAEWQEVAELPGNPGAAAPAVSVVRPARVWRAQRETQASAARLVSGAFPAQQAPLPSFVHRPRRAST